MFSDLTVYQKQFVYQALKKMIESCGIGFHNGDRRHPVYWAGAKGKEDMDPVCPDGPEQNDLYKMLSALSKEFKEGDQVGYTWFYDFSEWQDFCKFAINPGDVYITSGEKYHLADCYHSKYSATPITKQEAIAKGYTPCSVCIKRRRKVK